jgi:hypothetical protein
LSRGFQLSLAQGIDEEDATMRMLLLAALLSLPLALPQDHSGQPKSCDNVSDNPHKCECERAQRDCDPHNQTAGQKCKTYCRPDACKCVNPCNSD